MQCGRKWASKTKGISWTRCYFTSLCATKVMSSQPAPHGGAVAPAAARRRRSLPLAVESADVSGMTTTTSSFGVVVGGGAVGENMRYSNSIYTLRSFLRKASIRGHGTRTHIGWHRLLSCFFLFCLALPLSSIALGKALPTTLSGTFRDCKLLQIHRNCETTMPKPT